MRESDYDRVYDLGAERIEPGNWQPLSVEYIRDGSAGTAVSDLVFLGIEPAFTARAVEALQDVLFPYGQILPLRSPDGEFYLWNITNVIDALDEDRCDLTRFASSERVMMVRKWAFRPHAIGASAAFKVSHFPRAFPFVTEAFVSQLRRAGLLGFAPDLVWQASATAVNSRGHR